MEEKELLEITIKTISSADYLLSYPATSTIHDLKKHLIACHPILPSLQNHLEIRLISSGRLLNDTAKLYQIPKVPGSESNIIIHLVTKSVPSTSPAPNKSEIVCTSVGLPIASKQVPSQTVVESPPAATNKKVPSAWPFSLPFQVVYINGVPYAMTPAYPATSLHNPNLSNIDLAPIHQPFTRNQTQSTQPHNHQPSPAPEPQQQPAQPNNRMFVDDEFGERGANAQQGSWWFLLMKLGFILYIFGQNANVYRIAAMFVTALVIFLSQMGWIRLLRLEVVQPNPIRHNERPLGIGGGPALNNHNNGNEGIGPQVAGDIQPVAQVPIATHNLGLIGVAGQVLLRFLTSLIPS